jgi:uncharacterized protein
MLQQDSTEMVGNHSVSERVFIPFAGGSLEGWLAYDEEWTLCDGVILLSPHPHFAGTMDNNVIRALAASLSEAGFVALRFNYPGIGASSIELPEEISVLEYWNTVEEEQRFKEAIGPAFAVLTYLNQSLGPNLRTIHLLGYSYGAMIALLVAEKMPTISSVTAISLPWVARYDYSFLRNVSCPKLFISGKQDFAFDRAVYQRAWSSVAESKGMKFFDCDHFFRKREKELGNEVLAFLLRHRGEGPVR